MTEFKLGTTLRDKVSGLSGIATARHEMFNGCIQYSIEPEAKDGKRSETIGIDTHSLENVPDGRVIELPVGVVPQTTDIKIGDPVEDIITGLKGTVTEKTLFINGCLYLTFTTKQVDVVGEINSHFLPVARLKRAGKSLFERVGDCLLPRVEEAPKKPDPVPVKDKPKPYTGGPSRTTRRPC